MDPHPCMDVASLSTVHPDKVSNKLVSMTSKSYYLSPQEAKTILEPLFL